MNQPRVPFPGVSRRSFLGGAGAVALMPILAACGGGGSSSSTGGGSTITFGSADDPGVQTQAHHEIFDAFTKETGITVKVNAVDHNTFQQQIDSYLQATPQDVFGWGASYRMRDLANRGLADNVDAVWKKMGDQVPASIKSVCTNTDGHLYYVPFDVNPWVVYYRKSLWAQKGYEVPKTWDAFMSLAKKMKSDGLTPIAFSDKDGWPALAWFDYLDMRINGYDYHMQLMNGTAKWTDPQVKSVFDTWSSILPYTERGANGLTWQQSAQTIVQKTAGMALQSGFLVSAFSAADISDLDVFPFPEVDSAIGSGALEAPLEGFMVAKRGIPKNPTGVEKFMEYLMSAAPQETYTHLNQPNTPVNLKANKSNYSPLQVKLAGYLSSSKNVSQYLDDDANPTFAQTVIYPTVQKFIGNPSGIGPLLASVEKQKVAIYAQSQK